MAVKWCFQPAMKNTITLLILRSQRNPDKRCDIQQIQQKGYSSFQRFKWERKWCAALFIRLLSPADLRKDENNWPNERADVQQFHLLFLKCSSAVWSVQSARIKQIVLEVAFEWVRKGVMTLVTSGLVRSDTYGGRCSATECGARVEKLLPCPPRGGLSSAQYPFSL